MKIDLLNAGKRFNRDWIFRHFNYTFSTGHSYAITGANGSGKSTLLQLIASSSTISEGTINYYDDSKIIDPNQFFNYISLAAPYLELVEEMTLTEFFNFHHNLKGFYNQYTASQIIEIISLEKAAKKEIRYFSSGMKQRVKLAQAIFSNVPVVLLDEPLTNLDTVGIHLYKKLIAENNNNRLFIISSNDPNEYDFCDQIISMDSIKMGTDKLSPAGN